MQNSQEGFYARSKFLSRCPQGINNKIIFFILLIRLRSHLCSRFQNSHCAVEMQAAFSSGATFKCLHSCGNDKIWNEFFEVFHSTIPLRNRVFNCNLIKSSSSIILQNCGCAIAIPIAAQLLDHRAIFRLNRARSASAAQSFQSFCGAMHCTSRTLKHETGCGPMFAAATLWSAQNFNFKMQHSFCN